MCEIYSVNLEQKEIGSARISREGLYCRVNCICQMQEERLYILYVKGAEETLRLGILVPKDGKLCLDTKLPAKRFPLRIDEIYLLEKGKEKAADGIILEEGKAVNGLENLMCAKLRITPKGAELITEGVSRRK